MTAAHSPEVRVERVASLTEDARWILAEYYESLGVVQRDDDEAMERLLGNPRSAMWLAYREDGVAGCVVMRAGVPEAGAGECKRLYVRPVHRGAGVAAALMEALEGFARGSGMEWVYLDTNVAFAASVALYRRRGYQECAAYNENPQATLFFRKRL